MLLTQAFIKNNRFLKSLLKIPGFINMYGTLQKDIFLTKSKRQKIDYDFIKLKNFNNKVFYILFLFFKLKTYSNKKHSFAFLALSLKCKKNHKTVIIFFD